MNGAIFGFQKRVWWPKWTPASSISRMDDAMGLDSLSGLVSAHLLIAASPAATTGRLGNP
jgi:hypothetical protein